MPFGESHPPRSPSRISTSGCSPHTLKELLQAPATTFDPVRGLNSHVAIRPRLPLVAGLLLFASWIGQNESILKGLMLEPPVSTRLRERQPEPVARSRVRETNCGTELMLAVARCRAHLIGVPPEDTLQPFVGVLLLLVGAVG